MIAAIQDLTDVQLVLLILAVFTGVLQLSLLATMAIHGGHVTIWWGVASVALFVALVVMT